jgi:hypothetical protein
VAGRPLVPVANANAEARQAGREIAGLTDRGHQTCVGVLAQVQSRGHEGDGLLRCRQTSETAVLGCHEIP